MIWFLILVLTVVAVLALMALVMFASSVGDDTSSAALRNELELLRAERRLHDSASSGFQAMLDEARRSA